MPVDGAGDGRRRGKRDGREEDRVAKTLGPRARAEPPETFDAPSRPEGADGRKHIEVIEAEAEGEGGGRREQMREAGDADEPREGQDPAGQQRAQRRRQGRVEKGEESQGRDEHPAQGDLLAVVDRRVRRGEEELDERLVHPKDEEEEQAQGRARDEDSEGAGRPRGRRRFSTAPQPCHRFPRGEAGEQRRQERQQVLEGQRPGEDRRHFPPMGLAAQRGEGAQAEELDGGQPVDRRRQRRGHRGADVARGQAYLLASRRRAVLVEPDKEIEAGLQERGHGDLRRAEEDRQRDQRREVQ